MNTHISFREFYLSLSEEERVQYAAAAGTTVNYIETHLVCVPPRKVPRPALMGGLSAASGGRLSREALLRHFYPPEEGSRAI